MKDSNSNEIVVTLIKEQAKFMGEVTASLKFLQKAFEDQSDKIEKTRDLVQKLSDNHGMIKANRDGVKANKEFALSLETRIEHIEEFKEDSEKLHNDKVADNKKMKWIIISAIVSIAVSITTTAINYILRI